MKTHNRSYNRPVDVHAALARAHADRAAYVRMALVEVPVLLRRLGAKLRPGRQRLPGLKGLRA
jgi:hypothetical protein